MTGPLWKAKARRAFSLVELLVSITVLALLMTILGRTLATVSTTHEKVASFSQQFGAARAAFDSITTRLSSAEMSPYWDYEYPNGNRDETPTRYLRSSELHFVSGGAGSSNGYSPALLDGGASQPGHAVFFHGAFGVSNEPDTDGLGSLVNALGYYLEFGPDPARPSNAPSTLPQRYRYRLLELQVPSEDLGTFQDADASGAIDLSEASTTAEVFSWFRNPVGVATGVVHPVADNVIAFIVLPLPAEDNSGSYDPTALAPDYYYDSRGDQHPSGLSTSLAEQTRHRLPPLVRITMVAIDEASAFRLSSVNGTAPPALVPASLFQSAYNYEDDLRSLESSLQSQNLDFRVFTTTVRLRNAR